MDLERIGPRGRVGRVVRMKEGHSDCEEKKMNVSWDFPTFGWPREEGKTRATASIVDDTRPVMAMIEIASE